MLQVTPQKDAKKVVTREPARVFDIGMFDGTDTAYYLSKGFSVVAVDANPLLIEQARKRFAKEIAAGRLFLENVAVGNGFGKLTLHLCGDDLGSSTLYADRISHLHPTGLIEVDSVPMTSLFERHGVPYYLKCDIEGADRQCILGLDQATKPQYVSFEMGSDAYELLAHLRSLGYSSFKVIDQVDFREIENVECIQDRILRRLRVTFGLSMESRTLRRDGYRFPRGFSSGPMAERTDGKWWSYEDVIRRWERHQATFPPGRWYDLHAKLGS
jgi:FkbM family methyltransferase